jgi:3-oxoacyl-[acyl-carrier-protein] synthase-3
MAMQTVKRILDKRPDIPREQTSIILAGNTHMPFLNPQLPLLIPCEATKIHQNINAGHAPAFDVITTDISSAIAAATQLTGSPVLVDATISSDDFPRMRELKKGAIVYHHNQTGLAQKIAKEFGLNVEISYDLTTGCASHGYGLALADAAIRKEPQYVIVIGVDKMHQVTNQKDRKSVVLFGELAGAALLGPSEQSGFIYNLIETDSTMRDAIKLNNGYFEQNGRAVYTWAVKKAVELIKKGIEHCKEPPVVVPHQANPSMLKAVMAQKDFPTVKDLVITGDKYGNSSTASPAHAFDLALKTGRIQRGDHVLFVEFGAGLSYSLNVYRHV